MGNIVFSSGNLSSFEASVTMFKDNIESCCDSFSNKLVALESDLRDISSKNLLQYGHSICAQIRSILNPSILILELIQTYQKELDSGELDQSYF